jgi:two-component system sensor histidine kinase RegB
LGSRAEIHGLGLGLFIATNLLERTGGRVTFRNSETGGALVETVWPRHHIDVGNMPTGQ